MNILYVFCKKVGGLLRIDIESRKSKERNSRKLKVEKLLIIHYLVNDLLLYCAHYCGASINPK